MIDEAVVDPDLILLENVSHEDREESGSTFNKGAEPNCGPNIVVGDETLSGEDPFTKTPKTIVATAARASSTSTPINTTNPSTTNLATTDPASIDPDLVSVDPTTVDLNDTDVGLVGFDLVEEDSSDYSTEESVDTKGELVGDDDEDYDSDVHEEVRELRAEKKTFQRRKRNEKEQADTEEVPVGEAGPNLDEDECCDEDEHNSDAESSDSGWVNLPRRLGMVFSDVNEFRRAVTTYDVQRRVQPSIRVLKLQDLIRKKLKVHVGKTTVRRARAKVLKDIMGDHIVEFGRILDYKDELLRTNPGTTCVVKLDEHDALAVEYENKNTWTWFVKLLKTDLGLRDGGDLTLITDMQKGLSTAIEDLLPAAEHRMCARHILANWAKDWRGLQRRQQFWRIAKMREGLCQHTVDLGRRNCSSRVWQLKGIPCAHVMAAIYFKNCDHIDYIDSCYSKETYLRTYANVLQPITNMEIWPISTTNPTVAPPEIKSMSGRPGHNKRGCPQNVQSSAREEPSGSGNGKDNTSSSSRGGKTSVSGSGRGRPKNPSTEGEPPAKRGRGRPRKTHTAPPTPLTYPTLSAPPSPTATSLPTTSKRGRPIKTPHAHPAYLEHPAPPTSLPTTSKRGRPRKTPPAHPAYLEHPAPPTSLPTTGKRGRPRKTPPAHPAYLEHPAPPTSLPTTSKRGKGQGK
ncbi:hypothetical protein MTR67_044771 [Solanum verrucosum]|uniref:SWIM-type domain-containing protein n=1 Tax=Solanum verrucosum TaxID=315347 RepID=A0AAF0UUK9_SOLVR|nr:hypothetical protein MTR67_044771 [Solanum verrucosum]